MIEITQDLVMLTKDIFKDSTKYYIYIYIYIYKLLNHEYTLQKKGATGRLSTVAVTVNTRPIGHV
jgi:hypothetical protein